MINETNNETWCVNAFHSMSANNDGSTKMCCMIDKAYNSLSTTDTNYFIGERSIAENFNNPVAEEIRTALNDGKRHPACRLCWEEEDGGRKSKRMRDNERYLHEIKWHDLKPFEGLAKFELNLGNNCNIKCRTCHPTISSTWMKESYDLDHSHQITFKQYSNEMKKYHQQYDEDSDFWPDLEKNLQTIKQFDFYGGEPFLSKKMWEILAICVEKGYAKDIELHYNTNGTTWPKETDLWQHFKSINLSFSIDGIGERFEYMRFPAKWDVVRENMQKARDYKNKYKNMSLSWCITLSSINIYYLPETLDEYYQNYSDFGVYLNLVHGPICFNVSKIPDQVKEKVFEKFKQISEDYESIKWQLPGIIGFIQNGKHDPEVWKDFFFRLRKHDEYRKQDFFETFKEYAAILER